MISKVRKTFSINTNLFFAGCFALVFVAVCLFSFLPISSVSVFSSSLEGFETFTSQIMLMQEKYSSAKNSEIAVQANLEGGNFAKTEQNLNRLIVYTTQNVENYDAILSANWNGWHVNQYETNEQASMAFEKYSNLGVSVCYDEKVSLLEDKVEENLMAENPWADKTFNSWGANFVGYSSFVANMYQRHSFEALEEVETIYVAVLDSGINPDHNLFKNSSGSGSRIDSTHAVSYVTTDKISYGQPSYKDLNGHGSHVSGTIAEFTLDNVKIIPVKVLDSEGEGYVSSIVSGLEHIEALKKSGLNVKVANMSIGIDTSSSTGSYTNVAMKTAIEKAYEAGIISVVSAGNENMNTSYASPANVDCAFTVSAVAKTSNSSVTFASYSNFGTHVDFSAPGSAILSASKNGKTATATLSGTSMAAPHVTAAVALVYSNPSYKNYTPTEIYDLLAENTTDLGAEGKDNLYGNGLIDLSEIGVCFDGYVQFSEETGEKSESFQLDLSFESSLGEVKIFYTDKQGIFFFDATDTSSWKKFVEPILIDKTTKISAVAQVFNGGELVSQTYFASKEFYFDHIDLAENFTFSQANGKATLTAYQGILTTLKISAVYDGAVVSKIGEHFLKGTGVSKILLPNTLEIVYEYAFESNSKLTKIEFYDASNLVSLSSKGVNVEKYAFYKCVNVTNFDFSSVRFASVGEYAFAYCSGLTEMKLFDATSIGKHAFSGSGVKKMWLGQNVSTIGTHSLMNLGEVYGYAGDDEKSTAEIFAEEMGASFVDLSLHFTNDFGNLMVVRAGENFVLDIAYAGYMPSAKDPMYSVFPLYFAEPYLIYYSPGLQVVNDETTCVEGEFDGFISITFNGLSAGTYDVYVCILDYYGNVAESNTIQIVATENTCTLTKSASLDSVGKFKVFVEDTEVRDVSFFEGEKEYSLKIQAENGFKIASILLGGEEQMDLTSSQEISTWEIDDFASAVDVELLVTIAERQNLFVCFDTTNGIKDGASCADIFVEKTKLSALTAQVSRGGNLQFEIVPKAGYVVSRVTLSNQVLEAEQGIYTISDVNSDLGVEITFVVQKNACKLIYGGSFGVISSDGVDEAIDYGQSKWFTVTPSDGYKVDTVTVDGEIIEGFETVDGHYIFTVTNLMDDPDEVIDVVVSFKKEKTSLFSANSVVFGYFMAFLVMFLIFVIGKVVLHFVRKKQNNKNDLFKR